MTDVANLLAETKTILLVDWPSRDVPDTLARHGFTVVSHDDEASDAYNAYTAVGDDVRVDYFGRLPAHAEIVYTHRPVDELPEIVAIAQSIGARAVWVQSGRGRGGTRDPRGCWFPPDESSRARQIVEAAGLTYVEQPYIADAVREVSATP